MDSEIGKCLFVVESEHGLTEKTCHRNTLQALLSDYLPQAIPVRFNQGFSWGQVQMQILSQQPPCPGLWELQKQAASIGESVLLS